MKIRYPMLSIALFVALSNMHAQPWKLFFDIPVVLFETDEIGMSKEIGRASALWYALSEWKDPRALKNRTFSVLDTLGKQKNAPEKIVRSPEGHQLPAILCEWLAGTKKLTTITQQIDQQLIRMHNQKFFSSNREQSLITNAIQTILNPQILAQYTQPNSSSLKLFTKCAPVLGKQNLYMIGNWDKHSFKYILQSAAMQPLLSNFSAKNIFISGTTHTLFPDMTILEQIISRDSIDKNYALFISAMPTHIAAAHKLGYKTFLAQSPDYYKNCIQFLTALNII